MPSEVVYKPTQKIKKIYEGGTITPPKFTPTYYEWLFKDGQYINIFLENPASSLTTIYTIPDDYIFYLLSVSVTIARTGGTNQASCFVYTGSPPNAEVYLHLRMAGVDNTAHQVKTYPIPLKIGSKEPITVKMNGTSFSESIVLEGILVPKNTL